MALENPRRSRFGPLSIRVVTTCQAIQPKEVVGKADPGESWMDFFLKCGMTGFTVEDHIVCGGGPVSFNEAFRKAELTEKIGDLIDGGDVKIVEGHYSLRIDDKRHARRTGKKGQVAMTRSHQDTEAVGPLEPAPHVRQREDDDDLEVEQPPTNRRQDPASGRQSPAPSATRSGGGNASGQDDEEIKLVDVDNGAVARNPPPAARRPVRRAISRPFRGGAQDVSDQRVVRRERSEPRHLKRIVQQRLASFSNNWLLRVAEETKRLQENHLWQRNVAHMPYSCHFLQDLLDL